MKRSESRTVYPISYDSYLAEVDKIVRHHAREKGLTSSDFMELSKEIVSYTMSKLVVSAESWNGKGTSIKLKGLCRGIR